MTRERTFVERARRRQIIDCTVAVIARDGYAAASLAAIAREAGVSKPSVLYHFADKDELMRAVVGDVLGSFVAEVGGAVDAAAGDPEAALRAYLRGFLGYLHAHPTHVRVLSSSAGLADPADDSRSRNVAVLLDDGVDAGVFAAMDTRTVAVMINGALDGVVGAWLADPSYDLLAAADQLEASVLRMVSRRPERPDS